MTEVQVRIGDLATTARDGDRLVTVGLGSCVGVVVIDVGTGAAGLAHVFLPSAPPSGAKPGAGAGTYAETAVPTLVRQVTAASRRSGRPGGRRLVAVIAGGAKMFAARGSVDVGARNEQAVTQSLAALGIPVVASATGGSNGRTIRVVAGPEASVRVRQVGSAEQELWSAAPAVRSVPARAA